MTLNEDWGDQDIDMLQVQVQGFIASGWTTRLVRAMVPGRPADHDDLAQEANLEMWKVAGRWDGRGSLEGYLKQMARYRVTSLLRGDHLYTGQEGVRATTQRRGDETRVRLKAAISAFQSEHQRDPSNVELGAIMGTSPQTISKQRKTLYKGATDTQVHTSSLDAIVEEYGTVPAFLGVEEHLEAIALAYHYGEIYEAVSDLHPHWREYIYLRFWQGHTEAEVTRLIGVHMHWDRDIKPVLADRLDHLVGAS